MSNKTAIIKKYCNHNISKYVDNIYPKYSYDYINKKADIRSGITNKKLQNTNLVKDLPEEQKKYVTDVVDGSIEKSYEEIVGNNNDSDLETNVEPTKEERVVAIENASIKDYFTVSWVIIGFAVGIVIVAYWWGFRYLKSACVYVKNDIDEIFGVTSFAVKKSEEKGIKSIIDEWRYADIHFFSEDEVISIIQNKIKGMELNCIAVISAESSVNDNLFVEKCCDNIKDVQIMVLSNVLYNPDSMDRITRADGVVVVERMGKVSIAECVQLKQMICDNKLTMLGIVI